MELILGLIFFAPYLVLIFQGGNANRAAGDIWFFLPINCLALFVVGWVGSMILDSLIVLALLVIAQLLFTCAALKYTYRIGKPKIELPDVEEYLKEKKAVNSKKNIRQ